MAVKHVSHFSQVVMSAIMMGQVATHVTLDGTEEQAIWGLRFNMTAELATDGILRALIVMLTAASIAQMASGHLEQGA